MAIQKLCFAGLMLCLQLVLLCGRIGAVKRRREIGRTDQQPL